MTKPILYVFLISHYCEKARWALDFFNIDYEVRLLSPLNHAKTASQLGLGSSSLPILETSDGVIQGSSRIVAWAKANKSHTSRASLNIGEESLEIEKRLDDVLGVHVRRWFYSESLIDCPETVRPVFAHGASLFNKLLLSLAWTKVTAVMTKRMDLGSEQEAESRSIVLAELDWLDSLFEDGRSYLVGDSFSIADMTAASLLAPMFSPKNHPASELIVLPPRVATAAEQWRSRPFATHLEKLYQSYR